jgi:hypothetical protein
MRLRSPLLLACACFLAYPAVGANASPKAEMADAMYQGKPLSEWLGLFRKDEKGRAEAGPALAAMGAPGVAGLVTLLDTKEEGGTRTGAATALWQLREKAAGAVPALEKTLKHDPDIVVRLRAAQALTGIVGPSHRRAASFLRKTASSSDPKLPDWIKQDAKAIMRDAKVP